MKVCTLDIETDALLADVTKVWCAVIKDHDTGRIITFPHWRVREQSPYALSLSQPPENFFETLDSYDVIMTHNGLRFDWAVLRKLFGYEFHGVKVDTLQMSRLQRPNRKFPPSCPNRRAGPHSVEAWGYRLGRGKVSHDEWDRYSPEMLHRCVEDVEIQYLIYHELLREGKGEGWKEAHKLTFKLIDLLQKQEEYGWKVDREHIERCLTTLTRWIDRIDRAVSPQLPYLLDILEIKAGGEYKYIKKPFKKDGSLSASVDRYLQRVKEEGGAIEEGQVAGPFARILLRPVNLSSNSEVKEFLLQLGWVPDEWNTNNTGKRTSPKLSKDDTFHGIQGSLGKLIVKRVQSRQRRSILEGWKTVVREDGRMPAIITGLATTGRAKHKNVVNVPRPGSFFGRQMREVFICDRDKVLVGTDSDSNQARMLCARMGDEAYTEAVVNGKKEDGTDVHSVNQRIAGLSNRDVAKTFFYGILFGAGDAKTGRIVGGTAADGKAKKAALFNGLPAFKKLIDSLTEEWAETAKPFYDKDTKHRYMKNGWIRGMDGRPIMVDSPHKVLVYALQSDEAIMMSAAYVHFHEQMDRFQFVWGEDYGTVSWYHDEWTVECKPEIAEDVGRIACQAIKWAGLHYNVACPHKGNYKIGKNWAEIH